METDTKIITAIIGGIVTVIGSVLAYMKTKQPIAPKPIVKPQEKPKRKGRTINNHSIFFFLDDMEMDIKNSFIVPNTISDYKAKQEAFKDIMINKIRIWRKIFEKMATLYPCENTCESCKVSLADSRALHMRLLDEGITKYSAYFTRGGYTEEEVKALSICMRKFNELHLPNADFITAMIESTHTVNEFLPVFCPIGATGLILDSYKYTFHKMLEDVREAITTMNGDLKGLKFRRKNYSIIEED